MTPPDLLARLVRFRRRPHHVVVGLSSGTSADAVDAVVARLEDRSGADGPAVGFHCLSHVETPLSPELSRRILAAAGAAAADVLDLHVELGERFAGAAWAALEAADLPPGGADLVASHGQTLLHRPPEAGRRGASLQVGCAATIAERTGLPVVADFRARDLAAGGHGAPILARAERLLFAVPSERRVLLNLGGVANLTDLDGTRSARAFDVGPANALSDALVRLATGGRERFDRDGRRALAGTPRAELVAGVLADPFFAASPPKSLDRDRFGVRVARRWLATQRPLEDLLASAASLVAEAVEGALERLPPSPRTRRLFVSGGGARNQAVMRALRERLGSEPESLETLGCPGGAKEALAFAVLARETLLGRPGNEPEATGAERAVALGVLVP